MLWRLISAVDKCLHCVERVATNGERPKGHGLREDGSQKDMLVSNVIEEIAVNIHDRKVFT